MQDAANFYGTAPAIEIELELPPLPDGVAELWRTFCELSITRNQTGYGGAPIGYVEIVAYQRAYRMTINSWEVATLKAIDAVWLNDQAEQANAKSVATKVPDASR